MNNSLGKSIVKDICCTESDLLSCSTAAYWCNTSLKAHGFQLSHISKNESSVADWTAVGFSQVCILAFLKLQVQLKLQIYGKQLQS